MKLTPQKIKLWRVTPAGPESGFSSREVFLTAPRFTGSDLQVTRHFNFASDSPMACWLRQERTHRVGQCLKSKGSFLPLTLMGIQRKLSEKVKEHYDARVIARSQRNVTAMCCPILITSAARRCMLAEPEKCQGNSCRIEYGANPDALAPFLRRSDQAVVCFHMHRRLAETAVENNLTRITSRQARVSSQWMLKVPSQSHRVVICSDLNPLDSRKLFLPIPLPEDRWLLSGPPTWLD